MTKPPTFHTWIERLDATPSILRILAFLFMLVIAMLLEASKVALKRQR